MGIDTSAASNIHPSNLSLIKSKKRGRLEGSFYVAWVLLNSAALAEINLYQQEWTTSALLWLLKNSSWGRADRIAAAGVSVGFKRDCPLVETEIVRIVFFEPELLRQAASYKRQNPP